MDEIQVLEEATATPTEQEGQEKLLTQSQVNKIVQREKQEAAVRARREIEEEFQRKLEEANATSQQQSSRNQNVSREVDADAIYQQVSERINRETQAKQLEEEMSRVAQSYLSKVAQGREAYSDFDDIMKPFDPTAYPQLVYLISGLENGGDVLYELVKNPSKLDTLDRLAGKNPALAQSELVKIATAISDNRRAQVEAEDQQVNAPLDRLQPSRVRGSNGKMSTSDLRAQPWLRR